MCRFPPAKKRDSWSSLSAGWRSLSVASTSSAFDLLKSCVSLLPSRNLLRSNLSPTMHSAVLFSMFAVLAAAFLWKVFRIVLLSSAWSQPFGSLLPAVGFALLGFSSFLQIFDVFLAVLVPLLLPSLLLTTDSLAVVPSLFLSRVTLWQLTASRFLLYLQRHYSTSWSLVRGRCPGTSAL